MKESRSSSLRGEAGGGEAGLTTAEQTEREEKTNFGNMAMNRTWLELELSYPAGTSGTGVTPGSENGA